MNNFDPQHFSNTIYAFTLLAIFPPKHLTVELQKLILKENFTPPELRQVLIYNAVMKIYKRDDLVIETLPFDIEIYKNEDYIISNLELNVKKHLSDLNITFESSYWIKECFNRVDFYLSTKNMIVQVDGPSHFLDTGEYNMSTRIQNLILTNSGYQIFRINYKYWGILDEDEKTEYLRSAINNL